MLYIPQNSVEYTYLIFQNYVVILSQDNLYKLSISSIIINFVKETKATRYSKNGCKLEGIIEKTQDLK